MVNAYTQIDGTAGALSGTIRFAGNDYGTLDIGRSLLIRQDEMGAQAPIKAYQLDLYGPAGAGQFSVTTGGAATLSTDRLAAVSTFLANIDGRIGSAEASAAAQLGVWEIAHETEGTWNVSAGTFSAGGEALITSNSAAALANQWLDEMAASQWKPVSGAKIGMLEAPGAPARAIVYDFSILPASPAPEPATWASSLLGFGALGFVLRRRRPQLALA